MGARIEIIGPERAKELLELNTVNRRVRDRHVRKLAHDMANGNWRFTGEPIILNGSSLLDGQHRLQAVVLAGVSVEMLVVDDVDSEAMPFIDRGVPRTLADRLTWAGVANARVVGTVGKRLLSLKKGKPLSDGQALQSYTDSDIHAFAEANDEVIQWATRYGHRLSAAVGGTRSGWAVSLGWIVISGADIDAVALFGDEVVSGKNLGDGSPALALRNWSVQCGINRRRLRPDELLIATVKAFNNWTTGRPMKICKVMPTEKLPPVEVI